MNHDATFLSLPRLCPDSPQYCPRVINDQVNLTALQKHSLTAGTFKKDRSFCGSRQFLRMKAIKTTLQDKHFAEI